MPNVINVNTMWQGTRITVTKSRKLFTTWHNVTSQKMWIFKFISYFSSLWTPLYMPVRMNWCCTRNCVAVIFNLRWLLLDPHVIYKNTEIMVFHQSRTAWQKKKNGLQYTNPLFSDPGLNCVVVALIIVQIPNNIIPSAQCQGTHLVFGGLQSRNQTKNQLSRLSFSSVCLH
jgi:hypothetical protein